MADYYAKTIAVVLITGAFCFGFIVGLISWSVFFEIKESIHKEHGKNIIMLYETK